MNSDFVRMILPLLILGLVGYFGFIVVRGLVKGRISIADDEYYRRERPGPYWLWMLFHAGCAVFALSLAFRTVVEGFAS